METTTIDDGSIPKIEYSGEIKELRVITWEHSKAFLDPPSLFYRDSLSRKMWNSN